ncbi:MAG: hypothetical protein HQM04_09950 [Magnetococcales bacterium]|nr:hypothetical protein [Magnetococcales bacterium]MBF0115355.1 hypothetical protein [Magnetococcales bacterium]
MKIKRIDTFHVVAIALFGCVLALWHSGPLLADEDSSGSCARMDFSRFHENGKLKWVGVARAIRHDTPLFAEMSGNQKEGTLDFNQQMEISEESKDRVKVRSHRFKKKEPAVGWVRKSDLLCRNTPIKSDSGLEMKFFIKTDTVARNNDNREPTVHVFQEPELKECTGGKENCREGASRFHMYFVFDQTEQAVLLGDRFRLEEDDVLLGWVARKDGFIWNNAFSLRPREDLKAPDGKGRGTVCTYERLNDAISQDQKSCQPVEGGPSWFQSPLRIPVLDLLNSKGENVSPNELAAGNTAGGRRFYKVALARPGLVARRIDSDTVAIAPSLAKEIMPQVQALSTKKQVDIFFLLDATASMDPVIDAVRGSDKQAGVIQEIIHSLKNTQGFRETQFRFGFRVYRDTYADSRLPNGLGDGIGEGFPFPEECAMNPEQQKRSLEKFQEAIAKVQVTSDDADDYEENSLGGLEQALKKDMTACPDHLKLLFMIGDSGYREVHPVRGGKYRHPSRIDSVAQLLRGGDVSGGKSNNIIPFFIRTPSLAQQAKNPNLYKNAYELFGSQANQLLTSTLPVTSKTTEHFFQMGENNLVSRVLQTVEKLASSELINEIILDVRGGAALTAVIERLRRERVDIPGVYWHILKQGACGELGEQCERRVYDTTQIAYMEADDKIVEELWINSGELSSWIRILRGFEGYFDLPETQLRRALISALVLGLQQEIRRPPIDVAGETPAEYAQRRGGLPVRRHSPLLSYNVNALSAEQVERNLDGRLVVLDKEKKAMLDNKGQPILAAPVCELRRLSLWAIKSKEILEVIERDFFKPVYQATTHQARSCPDATSNGRALLKVEGAIQREPLGPDKSYHYAHTLGGRRGYWIPQEYLP